MTFGSKADALGNYDDSRKDRTTRYKAKFSRASSFLSAGADLGNEIRVEYQGETYDIPISLGGVSIEGSSWSASLSFPRPSQARIQNLRKSWVEIEALFRSGTSERSLTIFSGQVSSVSITRDEVSIDCKGMPDIIDSLPIFGAFRTSSVTASTIQYYREGFATFNKLARGNAVEVDSSIATDDGSGRESFTNAEVFKYLARLLKQTLDSRTLAFAISGTLTSLFENIEENSLYSSVNAFDDKEIKTAFISKLEEMITGQGRTLFITPSSIESTEGSNAPNVGMKIESTKIWEGRAVELVDGDNSTEMSQDTAYPISINYDYESPTNCLSFSGRTYASHCLQINPSDALWVKKEDSASKGVIYEIRHAGGRESKIFESDTTLGDLIENNEAHTFRSVNPSFKRDAGQSGAHIPSVLEFEPNFVFYVKLKSTYNGAFTFIPIGGIVFKSQLKLDTTGGLNSLVGLRFSVIKDGLGIQISGFKGDDDTSTLKNKTFKKFQDVVEEIRVEVVLETDQRSLVEVSRSERLPANIDTGIVETNLVGVSSPDGLNTDDREYIMITNEDIRPTRQIDSIYAYFGDASSAGDLQLISSTLTDRKTQDLFSKGRMALYQSVYNDDNSLTISYPVEIYYKLVTDQANRPIFLGDVLREFKSGTGSGYLLQRPLTVKSIDYDEDEVTVSLS